MLGMTSGSRQTHHQLSEYIVSRQESYIQRIKTVLSSSNPFKTVKSHDGEPAKLYNLMTKSIMTDEIEKNIVETESRGQSAFKEFVVERIIGQRNLWDKMTKIKLPGWNADSKEFKVKAGTEKTTLKATNSLYARLLVTARSAREDIDLKDAIGNYEFSTINHLLMEHDGKLHPCTDKSNLVHALENLVKHQQVPKDEPPNVVPHDNTCIIFDGMAVVQEMVVNKERMKTCKDLADVVTRAIDCKAKGYVIFDDYSVPNSLKDVTRKRRTGEKSSSAGFKVGESTPIREFTAFLASTETKDSLTLFLADKLIHYAKSAIVTVPRQGVLDNVSATENVVRISSTHEEADTKMILYAAAIRKQGYNVDIYSSDTDVLVLALSVLPQPGPDVALIMGTGEKRRRVELQSIFDQIGSEKIPGLCGMHALTGCDTTGFHGNGKLTCFHVYMNSSEKVSKGLSLLGFVAKPTDDVVQACTKYVCNLFDSRQMQFDSPENLRWYMFRQLKSHQGVERLRPTQGAILQLVLRAHPQCSNWRQSFDACPVVLDPLTLGWKKCKDGFEPILSTNPPVPDVLVQLTKCGCKSSKCGGRCSCRQNNLVCTELCKCEADPDKCENVEYTVINADDIDNDSVDVAYAGIFHY